MCRTLSALHTQRSVVSNPKPSSSKIKSPCSKAVRSRCHTTWRAICSNVCVHDATTVHTQVAAPENPRVSLYQLSSTIIMLIIIDPAPKSVNTTHTLIAIVYQKTHLTHVEAPSSDLYSPTTPPAATVPHRYRASLFGCPGACIPTAKCSAVIFPAAFVNFLPKFVL